MYETHLPYCLDPHTLETIGLETFNGAAAFKAMAAHFRLDMVNEVCTFNLSQMYNNHSTLCVLLVVQIASCLDWSSA